jgi:hypothetical protein
VKNALSGIQDYHSHVPGDFFVFEMGSRVIGQKLSDISEGRTAFCLSDKYSFEDEVIIKRHENLNYSKKGHCVV